MKKYILIFLTVLLLTLWLFPLFWLVVTSLKTEQDVMSDIITLIPLRPTLVNYQKAFLSTDIFRWLLNSFIVSFSVTAGTLVLDVPIAYALARIRFKGRRIVFWTVMAAMMIPFQVLIIPLYMQFNAYGILDTLAAEDGPSRKVTHNAGDRWTGGVADGLLYSEEVYDSTWNSIVLELDLDRLLTNAKAGLEEPGGQEDSRGEDRSRAAFCLLGLVLAELAAGTLPLGSRGTRGMGQVEVKAMAVTGGKGLGIENWSLKASQDGAGESLPRRILKGLRDVNSGIERNPRAGAGWEGWSSYLVGGSERPLEDKEERDA